MLYHQLIRHENLSQKKQTDSVVSSDAQRHRSGTAGSELSIRYSPVPSPAPAARFMKGLAAGARVKVCDIESGGTISSAAVKRILDTGYYLLDSGAVVSEAVVFSDAAEDEVILESMRTLIQYTGFNKSLPRSHRLPTSFPGHNEHTQGNVMNPVAHLQVSVRDSMAETAAGKAGETVEQRKARVAHAAAKMAFDIVTGHYFFDGNGRNAIYSIYDVLDKNQFYLRRTPLQVHAFLFGEDNKADFRAEDIDRIAEWIRENMTRKPAGIDPTGRRWSLQSREAGIRSLENDRRELEALKAKQGVAGEIMEPGETDRIRDWNSYRQKWFELRRKKP